jgi:hypothetical protein
MYPKYRINLDLGTPNAVGRAGRVSDGHQGDRADRVDRGSALLRPVGRNKDRKCAPLGKVDRFFVDRLVGDHPDDGRFVFVAHAVSRLSDTVNTDHQSPLILAVRE